MGIFRNKEPNDVIFLQPVRFAGEKLPRDKIRMLYCDASGKVHVSVMDRSVYRQARQKARIMTDAHRPFATVGLETGPGEYRPVTVDISPEKVWALEHILEHASKGGKIPDILKKHIKSILKAGTAARDASPVVRREQRPAAQPKTPKVLERLPYYPERDIEVSMPIYKATYSWPLVLLQRLAPDSQTLPNTQRLLVLDSDGDMAVINVPTRLVRQMELELNEQHRRTPQPVSALISQDAEGYSVDYMAISQKQKKALSTLVRHFEETGSGKQPISLVAQSVITRAKDRISS